MGRLRAALLRLNEWLTGEQAERVIFDLEHVNEVGIARNQKLHEYLTCRGARPRTAGAAGVEVRAAGGAGGGAQQGARGPADGTAAGRLVASQRMADR